jgi:hypothetical protein
MISSDFDVGLRTNLAVWGCLKPGSHFGTDANDQQLTQPASPPKGAKAMTTSNLIDVCRSLPSQILSAMGMKLRSRRRALRPAFFSSVETLETRDLMSVSSVWLSGSTLFVKANDSSTSVEIDKSGKNVVVTDETTHKSWSYASKKVSIVEFQGGAGNDRFENNYADMRVRAYGAGGHDYLGGGSGNDYFEGGSGDDVIEGGSGKDVLFGGKGNDILRGGSGNDQIEGENGDDRIEGGSGDDRVWGGWGNDVLLGNNGDDYLDGDDGDDHLNGGAGDDSLFGGNGADVLITIDGSNRDSARGGAGADVIWADASDTVSVVQSADKVHYVGRFANGADRSLNGDRIADPTVLPGHTTRQFANNPLFASNGPTKVDITQGALGDCYMLAGLAAIAMDNPHAIRQHIVDFDDGTYGVRMGDSFYRVDNDLAVSFQSSTSPAYAKLGQENSMWVAVYEKAWAHYRTGANTFASIVGGWGVEVNRAFGSTSAGSKSISSFRSATALAEEIANRLGNHEAVTMGFSSGTGAPLILRHAYTVVSVARDMADRILTITLRNPWGWDGAGNDGNVNDGLVTVTPNQLYGYSGHLDFGRV